MKVTYDKEAKALYIYIAPELKQNKTLALVDDIVLLDMSDLGQVRGIEVLGVNSIEDITELNKLGKKRNED